MPKGMKRCARVDLNCRRMQPCPEHTTRGWKVRSQNYEPLPKNWGSLVRAVIGRDKKVCQVCRKLSPDGQVDHKVNRAAAKKQGWTSAQIHSLSNLQWVCTPCHDYKTKMEAIRGRRR